MDGRVRAVRLGQKNAGVNAGNDHWLWIVDSKRLDSSPGALGSFWVSDDGAVAAYQGWRIRNVAPDAVELAFIAGWRAAENSLGFAGCDDSDEAMGIEWREYCVARATLTPENLS